MTPDGVRYAGIGLELVGLLLIGLDIRDRRKSTNQQSIGQWVAALARRVVEHLPLRKTHSATASLSATGTMSTVGKSLTPRWNVKAKTPTLEDRITGLEERMGRIEERAAGLESDLRREAEERRKAVDAERQAREATEEIVQQLVVRLTAGNLWYERIGVGLFFFGLMLTNLSEEIAGLL